MLRFARASRFWWSKPLVLLRGKAVSAELVVLAREVSQSEEGVWLNSRSRASGIVDLEPVATKGTYQTVRKPLPLFVAAVLDKINQQSGTAGASVAPT